MNLMRSKKTWSIAGVLVCGWAVYVIFDVDLIEGQRSYDIASKPPSSFGSTAPAGESSHAPIAPAVENVAGNPKSLPDSGMVPKNEQVPLPVTKIKTRSNGSEAPDSQSIVAVRRQIEVASLQKNTTIITQKISIPPIMATRMNAEVTEMTAHVPDLSPLAAAEAKQKIAQKDYSWEFKLPTRDTAFPH